MTLFTCAGSAFGHFPVSRGAALSPRGSLAIALPGFGMVMRTGAGEPFSYVCDALLEVAPSDVAPAMSFAADGSLLVGSVSGLRSVDANGCPRAHVGGALESAPIAAVAVHPARTDVVYAVTNATSPRVWQSSDGGTTWEQRGALAALDPVTALVLDPSDPDVVYVSQATPSAGGFLQVSKDGGKTFSTINQKAGLSLLDVEPAAGDAGTARFWAVGRSATAVTNQGFSLFSSVSPSGPWSAVYDVRFFGGFAREPGGALWFGDEAGGVYRSTDGGGSFSNVSSDTAVSCLHFAQGSLFGCTPGLATQNALVTWNSANQAFDGVVALSDVTRMVSCSADTDVGTTCAAAWVEWQRDILLLPQIGKDAGTPQSGTGGTGGAPPTAPLHDAGEPSTHPVPGADASTSPVGSRASSSGCSITTSPEAPNGVPRSHGAAAFGAIWLAAAIRRFRPRRARYRSRGGRNNAFSHRRRERRR